MGRYILLLLFIVLAFWGCEEDEPADCAGVAGGDNICGCTDSTATNYDSTATFDDESCEYDTTPPIVTITSPQDGSTVSDSITITCNSSDNQGVEKVELWVNGVSTDITDDSEPYSFDWNTTTVDDGSFTIIVRSYDLSGNTTDSAPITLIVYKIVELWGEYYSIENTTELNLSTSGLAGQIPPEIGNLTNLTDLRLSVNQLTGSIPPEIGNLTNLTWLDLSVNQFTGSIPSAIGNLTNLTWLDLSFNQLPGEIPSEIGNLTNLTYLWLSGNQLTGSIPSEIGNLTNLTVMSLWVNQLTGSIPSEIGNLTNLDKLWLYGNQLTGIPPEIGNLTNLTYLWLNDNQFTGDIPESICNLVENNCDINISNNQLCPPYPSCINAGEQDTSGCD
tara:strand:+ start:141 stop:1307 length:1167 start_codon:yes stop_codon:yes gene_type:complete